MKTFKTCFRASIIVIMLLSSLAASLPAYAYTMAITWPINRSVMQRNANNKANIYFAGQFFNDPTSETDPCPAFSFYYKVERLKLSDGTYQKDEIGWTPFSLYNTSAGLFGNSISNLEAGWFDLKVMATSGGVGGAMFAFATIRFGVGDVFIIAGQSNAQSKGVKDGFDKNTFLTSDAYDCVSVHNFDGACQKNIWSYPNMVKLVPQIEPKLFRVGPSGFNSLCWAPLGKEIADNQQVPTAFFNTAIGGTSVLNWEEGAKGMLTQFAGNYGCFHYGTSMADAVGQPYLTLKNSLKFYAKIFGVKALLWHQGEADTQAGTSAANYQSRLQYVINKSRTDFGSQNLTWYVSRASLTNGATSANVISGQNNLINADPNVHPGPQTDGINVRQDGTHIYMSGLTQHATSWRTAIYATPSFLFSAAVTPTSNFIMNSPGYPLQTVAGYSEYRWNDFSAPAASHITQGDGFCYVKDVSGNWYLTPKYLRTGFCGLVPEASPDEASLIGTNGKQYQLTISPNPALRGQASISFYVKQPGNIRLTVVDETGHTVQNVVERFHSAGRHQYEVKDGIAPGTYFCQLQADMIGVTQRFMISD